MLEKAKFDAAVAGVLARWEQLLTSFKPSYRGWLLVLESTNEEETYIWSDLIVQIREWIGERQLGQVKVHDWTIKNRDFEGSFYEKIKNIERDKLGILLPKTDNLYASAMGHPEMLVYELMVLAYSTACFDGQEFISAAHPTPNGSSTFSNLTTDELGYDALWTAISHFGKLRGANNQPLGIEPYVLWVGPDLQKVAAELITMERNAAGATNTLRNALSVKVCPEFTGDYAKFWQVWARPRMGSLVPVKPLDQAGSPAPQLTSPVTPYVVQNEKLPELSCTAPSGQSIFGMQFQDLLQFMRGLVAFGVDFRCNASFTLPELVYGGTGTNV